MKKTLLFQILLCLLVLGSAFYIRFRRQTDSVETLAGASVACTQNLTFSDLAETINRALACEETNEVAP
ncbi:MAG: hypothetical protein ACI4RV_02520 [Eubacteriales bacterium]